MVSLIPDRLDSQPDMGMLFYDYLKCFHNSSQTCVWVQHTISGTILYFFYLKNWLVFYQCFIVPHKSTPNDKPCPWISETKYRKSKVSLINKRTSNIRNTFMHLSQPILIYAAGISQLKVINRNTRTRCEICSKLTIKTPERRQALLLTLNIFHTLF